MNTNENLAEFEPAAIKPYFECTRTGVYYIGIETSKDGSVMEKPPLRLSDAIHIMGRGCDEHGSHYRVIHWQDPITHTSKTAALSMAEIGTNACWQWLQQRGITILSGRRKREILADYLQTDGDTTPYTITHKSGWTGKVYVLPNGECLNHHKEKVIYNGDTSKAEAYTPKGSLHEWQQQIGRYMAGNSRLCLAVGTALAAPLLHIMHEQNGAFHIYGDSSDGKTTAAKVALSVWGEPETLKMSWRGTDLGFSNAALSRNDGLLVLDEIGEADPRTISKTAYSVINGKSKLQGAKDGGNRPQSEWRILMFSTGEYALQAHLEQAGFRWQAGQSVRIPSIPAATQFGIYETLHGFASGAALSDYLLNTIEEQHGTVGRAWIEKLSQLDKTTIQAARDAFLSILPDLDGQAMRVAKRFALVAAALELSNDITGLASGVGMAGVKSCFDAWLELNGTGKYEDRYIIEQATNFMQAHADTMRFVAWDSHYTNTHHAGYRRERQGEATEYWITKPTMQNEVTKGFELRRACDVLHQVGWLKKSEDGYTFLKYGKGRFYVLIGIEPNHD